MATNAMVAIRNWRPLQQELTRPARLHHLIERDLQPRRGLGSALGHRFAGKRVDVGRDNGKDVEAADGNRRHRSHWQNLNPSDGAAVYEPVEHLPHRNGSISGRPAEDRRSELEDRPVGIDQRGWRRLGRVPHDRRLDGSTAAMRGPPEPQRWSQAPSSRHSQEPSR